MEHLTIRLKRLLLLLLDALESRDDEHAMSAADLRELMLAVGLGDEELDALLSWSRDRWAAETEDTWLAASLHGRASISALRQMGAREDEFLTVPAFDYLLRLVRTRQITAEQMEALIQFAQLAPEAPLTPGDLTPLLDRVVFRDADAAWPGDSETYGRAH
jgi:hypothetical protein